MQGDTIREIEGGYSANNFQLAHGVSSGIGIQFTRTGLYAYGAITFPDGTQNGSSSSYNWGKNDYRPAFKFKASNVVPTSNEVRPVNMSFRWFIVTY